MSTKEEHLLTLDEMVKRTNVRRGLISYLCLEGLIRAEKRGRSWYVFPSEAALIKRIAAERHPWSITRERVAAMRQTEDNGAMVKMVERSGHDMIAAGESWPEGFIRTTQYHQKYHVDPSGLIRCGKLEHRVVEQEGAPRGYIYLVADVPPPPPGKVAERPATAQTEIPLGGDEVLDAEVATEEARRFANVLGEILGKHAKVTVTIERLGQSEA